MTRNRLLVLLFVVLCGAIVYAWIETPRQRRVTAPASSKNVSTSRVAQQLDIAPEIEDLDFSGGTENQYQKPNKNLFAALYQPPKVVKRKPRKPKPKPKPIPKVIKVPPKLIQPAVRAPRPVGPPPMEPLNILGHMKKDGKVTVFLSSYKGEIFIVKKGDRFFDDLDVLDINDSNILIRRKRTGQQVSLQLGKTVSQRLPKMKIDSGRPEFSFPDPSAEKTVKETSEPADPRNLFRSKPQN